MIITRNTLVAVLVVCVLVTLGVVPIWPREAEPQVLAQGRLGPHQATVVEVDLPTGRTHELRLAGPDGGTFWAIVRNPAGLPVAARRMPAAELTLRVPGGRHRLELAAMDVGGEWTFTAR